MGFDAHYHSHVIHSQVTEHDSRCMEQTAVPIYDLIDHNAQATVMKEGTGSNTTVPDNLAMVTCWMSKNVNNVYIDNNINMMNRIYIITKCDMLM